MARRKLIALGAVFLLSGCAGAGGNDVFGFGPHIVEGNSAYVVIYDAIGLKDKELALATGHCAGFQKVPSYRGVGGNSLECSNKNLCIIYDCVRSE